MHETTTLLLVTLPNIHRFYFFHSHSAINLSGHETFDVCEQLAQGCYVKVRGRESNPQPSKSQVHRCNHYATRSYRSTGGTETETTMFDCHILKTPATILADFNVVLFWTQFYVESANSVQIESVWKLEPSGESQKPTPSVACNDCWAGSMKHQWMVTSSVLIECVLRSAMRPNSKKGKVGL